LYEISKSTVDSPRKWIYAGFKKEGYDMSALKAKKAKTTRVEEEKRKAEEEAERIEKEKQEIEGKKQTSIKNWIVENPEKYSLFLQEFFNGSEKNPATKFFYPRWVKSAKENEIELLEYCKTDKYFLLLLREEIYKEYLSK